MKAMVLESIGTPLKLIDRPDPIPGVGEIRLKVEACAICRTDLHVVDGDLPHPNLPVIPGHEIVGVIDSVGEEVARSRLGRRVGVPWLGHTCGHCPYCAAGSENLCDQPLFTGYTR
ncbi:MAG: alcohol dehydrogenase, partial [Mesorhizobium sp.]